MGLIGNNFIQNFTASKMFGSGVSLTQGNWATYTKESYNRSQSGATTVLYGNATPTGSSDYFSFFQPGVGGQMALRAEGLGGITADLVPSKSMELDLTGQGDITLSASLVISMLLNMIGSGDFDATISGAYNMELDMTGTGDLDCTISALGNMGMALTGTGDLSALIAAYGNMELNIVVTGTGLTTANVGQAVWSALASLNNDPNTMGELLNNAGAGGNPWTVLLEGSYTAADLIRLLASVAAGKTNINNLGGGNAEVTFRDLQDTKDRVEATMNDSERTNVTLDLSE